MNIKEYQNLKKQVDDKYQNAVALAEKQRKEGLEAIEKVWAMLNENPTVSNNNIIQTQPTTQKDYGSLTTAVKEAIKLVQEKFTKNDILLVMPQVSREISENIKQGSLSGCLLRLEKQGFIEIVKRGSGSIATIYKKTAKFKEELFENP